MESFLFVWSVVSRTQGLHFGGNQFKLPKNDFQTLKTIHLRDEVALLFGRRSARHDGFSVPQRGNSSQTGDRRSPSRARPVPLLRADHDPQEVLRWRLRASLLSDRYLLTAAHCVTNSLFTPSFTAFAGMTDLNDRFTSKVQRSQIVEVIYPKDNLTGKTDLGDIAILKMENPITFSSTVQPTKIVRNDSSLTVASKEGVLIGYGKTTWKEDVPSTTHDLLYAEVPFVDEKLCKRVYGKRATEREFCAGGKGKGQAPGDSGGPFGVIKNGEWIQVGLPSQGFSTNNKKLNPSILTRVASYCDFIEETTKGAFLCF
ncbi:hypothetical protein L596_024392 [Steinernema carpocapsae]|uniref:Peptidase S1 domain-containing protein n=1 Tax=Steinernema carpocapsae TaxID=34508 RepID=A0A4U5MHC2_STECR|nr:hypothetical protein L596_024392 [Steinernema carpocapsae]